MLVNILQGFMKQSYIRMNWDGFPRSSKHNFYRTGCAVAVTGRTILCLVMVTKQYFPPVPSSRIADKNLLFDPTWSHKHTLYQINLMEIESKKVIIFVCRLFRQRRLLSAYSISFKIADLLSEGLSDVHASPGDFPETQAACRGASGKSLGFEDANKVVPGVGSLLQHGLLEIRYRKVSNSYGYFATR